MIGSCPNIQDAFTSGQAGEVSFSMPLVFGVPPQLCSLLVVLALLGSGCLPYSTDSTEVGVRTRIGRVGRSTEEIKEKLVRPACRTYVRDLFNELDSERFYNAEKRLQKGSQAHDKLKNELGSDGIIIEQVIVGQYYLNPDYQRVIHDRKIAEQAVERIKSECQAAQAEQSRNLESAKGDVQVQIAQARGEAQQIRIIADRDLYQKEREAKAVLAEAQGRAKGVEKQNQAMAGAGGRTAVKLRIAESLTGKPIIIVPRGSGASLQTLDINRFLGSIITKGSSRDIW